MTKGLNVQQHKELMARIEEMAEQATELEAALRAAVEAGYTEFAPALRLWEPFRRSPDNPKPEVKN